MLRKSVSTVTIYFRPSTKHSVQGIEKVAAQFNN